MEVLHCDDCNEELEVGQIGLCDDCQELKKCCPYCLRPSTGWPLRRPDRCSPKGWVNCIRNQED